MWEFLEAVLVRQTTGLVVGLVCGVLLCLTLEVLTDRRLERKR